MASNPKFGMHCIAAGCNNYYYKNPDKHYHRLPSNEARLKAWLQVLKLKQPPVDYGHVCSDHFLPSDYVTKGGFDSDGRFSFQRSANLSGDAIPSVFNFSAYSASNTDIPSTSCRGTDTSDMSRSKRYAKRIETSTKRKLIEVSYSAVLNRLLLYFSPFICPVQAKYKFCFVT